MRHFAPSSFTGVRNNTGVSEDALRKYVPSIFATEPHESRSSRYEFIPTWDVLKAMQGKGFVITSAQQARTRDVGKREHTKHLIRLRHVDHVSRQAVVGDSVFELLLKNSHDGTSLYELMGGLYRFVCANGMVVGDHLLTPLKVMHTGNVSDQVIDASYTVIEQSERVGGTIDQWKRLSLSGEEQELYAEEAARLRFSTEDGAKLPVSARQLLVARRADDVGHDLWSVFNRVQENCIKGGMQGITRNSRGAQSRRAVRQVKGIDQDIRLNKALWTLAEGMANLKKMAA